MPYTMIYKVDGGCRKNGSSDANGAAAAVMIQRNGGWLAWIKKLPKYPTPTNQRAELTAIIVALKLALEKYDKLVYNPYLNLTIKSDSKYAVGCMNDWVYKWSHNGWTNAAGNPVVNQDLIREASNLDERVKKLGSVTYQWIPRGDNQIADQLCNTCLDNQG